MVDVQLGGLAQPKEMPQKKSGIDKEGRVLAANVQEKNNGGPKLFAVPIDNKHGVIV
jgi:hypothetical protein